MHLRRYAEQQMIKAVVGAGGKTTLIKKMAAEYLAQGKTVLVMTSTQMYIEADTLLTDDAGRIMQELEQKRCVMAGVPDGVKIRPLSQDTYETVCRYADVVLIEADGSRHKPIKAPKAGEPVIYHNVDEIIVVCGIHALGQALSEAAYRPELVKQCLLANHDVSLTQQSAYRIDDDTVITPVHLQKLVMEGYVKPLRQKYPQKKIRIEVMGAASAYEKALADRIEAEKDVSEYPRIGCAIMASGRSRRFGTNKLVYEFEGKTLIQRILDTTETVPFAQRIVLTRSEEVRQICEAQNTDVRYHALQKRNEAVRLGITELQEVDACMFCPCDQPLLRRASLERLIDAFAEKGRGIFRLCCGERQGTPILFGKEYFAELADLPEKCGGSYLVKKYPDQVSYIEAEDELELYDIDTPEDGEALRQILKQKQSLD